jgi:hypothetical protein
MEIGRDSGLEGNMIKLQQAQGWMLDGAGTVWQAANIVLRPPEAKLGAELLQIVDQVLEGWITGIAGMIGAELGHKILGLVFKIRVRGASAVEIAPDDVKRVRREWLMKLK